MKKRKRSKRRYTARQALFTKNSGAPTIHNAANLVHFWNRESFSGSKMIDQRGDFIWTIPEEEAALAYGGNRLFVPNEDNDLLIGMNILTSSTNYGSASGSLFQLPAGDDFLMIFAGRAADELPGDDLRFRIGGGDGDGQSNWFRQRSQKDLPLGDTVHDDNGSFIINAARQTAVMDTDMIMVSAIDNTNTLLHTQTYRGGSQIDNVQTSIAGIGDILPSADATHATPVAIGGWWYGCGIWTFPGGTLPADWEIAAEQMGLAWMQGAFNMWVPWGVS